MLLLTSCATVSTFRTTPDSAPLSERPLSPGQRDAYVRVSGSAQVDGAAALYFLGLDRAAAGDWPAAADLWRLDVGSHVHSGWDRLAQFKLAQSFEKQGNGLQAFILYQSLLAGKAVADLPERSRTACLRLIGTLGEKDLGTLVSGYALPEFLSPLRIRLLWLAWAAGRLDEVRRGVDDYLKAYPQGPGLDQIEDLSQKLESSVVVDRRSIGLVVPLTGVMAAFGTQVEQGVKLALDSANAGRADADKIRLEVADEGSDTATAVRAADGLIEQGHVIGLLGPLSSDSTEALVPLLTSRRTPMLSPSATRPDLAGISPWFFRDTLSPESQASAMADYAVVASRLTRVATLAPDDGYGAASALAFAKRLRELGGVVPVAVTYAPGTRDFRDAMLALGGVDPGVEKSADQDEMRDQQEKVEQACNAIGDVLSLRSRQMEGPTASSDLTDTPKVRLLVVDFAQDTECAKLNAGRAFSDRFARTLAQLDGVEVVGPQAALRYWTPLTPTAEGLTPVQAAQAAQAAGADFVLTGYTATLPPDPVKWPNRGLYSLDARLLDALTTTTCAEKSFTWTQYKAPPSNTLGLNAVYVPAEAEDVVQAVPDMLFFDLNLPLLGSDQWDRPELRDHLAELNGDVFTVAYWGDGADGAVKRFDAAYRAAYAAKPDVLAAQAYDAAGLMAAAILGGVSNRAALRAYLSRVGGYDGACGHFGFGGRQDADRRPGLVAVKAGSLVLVKEP